MRIVHFMIWTMLLTACSQFIAPGTTLHLTPTQGVIKELENPTRTEFIIGPVGALTLQVAAHVSQAGVSGFTWLPEGQALAIATTTGIVFYNLTPSIQAFKQLDASNPTFLTVSQQGLLAYASADHKVHVWSENERRELTSVATGSTVVTGLAFAPNDMKLASALYDQTLQVWEASSGALINQWKLNSWLSNLAYSPDGKYMGGADQANFIIDILDASSGQIVRELKWEEHASPVLYGAYFSPDWQRIAWVARGTVQIMDVSNGTKGPTLEHEDFINAIAWSPDGRLFATEAGATVNGNFQPVVFVWDVIDGKVITTLVQDEVITSLSFSPDGRELAMLKNSGALQVWKITR
jgi:WD40 repeat protein